MHVVWVKSLAVLLQGTKNLPKDLLSSIFLFKMKPLPFLCGMDIYLYELLGLMISMLANIEGARSVNRSSEVFAHVHRITNTEEKRM